MQIIIQDHQKRIPISKRKIKATVLKALKILNPVRNTRLSKSRTKISNGVKTILAGELTIVFVDNRSIQELNYRFLGRRRPTDVLCFDLSHGQHLTADIVISTEKAWENARLFKTSTLREVKLYLIHGILHLLGFKDKRIKDRIRMQRKALKILKSVVSF